MLKVLLPRTTRRTITRVTPSISVTAVRSFTHTPHHYAKDPKMSSGPPKHEMAFFPNMTAALPSESAEFRRVLWTGLYSQVVLMTVPVGGDIGDEVRPNFNINPDFSGCIRLQWYNIILIRWNCVGPHSRPSPDLHLWHWQSNNRGQRSRRQSRRSDGRTSWHTTSIRQYRTYATSTLAPFSSVPNCHSPSPSIFPRNAVAKLHSFRYHLSYRLPQILYTIYSPAEHNPQTVHKTKGEGDEEEENGKDEAPDWSRQPKAENEKKGLVKTDGKY